MMAKASGKEERREEEKDRGAGILTRGAPRTLGRHSANDSNEKDKKGLEKDTMYNATIAGSLATYCDSAQRRMPIWRGGGVRVVEMKVGMGLEQRNSGS